MEGILGINEISNDADNYSACSSKIKKILDLFNDYTEENYINLQPLMTSLTAEEINTPLPDGQTLIGLSILIEDERPLKLLLENGGNPNQISLTSDENEVLPLSGAILLNRINHIELLLSHGSIYSIIPNSLNNILEIAVTKNRIQLFRKLAANAPSDIIQGQLSAAIRSRSIEIIHLLVRLEVDLNQVNDSMSPLVLAASQGDEDICKMLIHFGAKLNRDSGSQQDAPLILAVKQSLPKAVQTLLQLGAEYNVTEGTTQVSCGPFHYHTVPVGNSALHLAVLGNNGIIAKMLVEAGSNLNQRNYEGDTPLHLACKDKDKGYEMVKLLITLHAERHARTAAAGGDKAMRGGHEEACHCDNCNRYRLTRQCLQLNAKNCLECTPLMEAIQCKNTAVVDLLLSDGADPCIRCESVTMTTTALHLAVKVQSMDVCQKLLKAGCSIDSYDKDGFTSLHLAASKGNLEIVKLLIDVGAKVKNLTLKDDNLLHLAIGSKSKELIQYILEYNLIDISSQNAFQWSPLMLAARIDTPWPTALLVKHGAPLNARDMNGETALLHAVYFGSEHNAAILIAHGADMNISDRGGCTPLYWCIFNGRIRTLQLLLLAGASLTMAEFLRYPCNVSTMRDERLKKWVERHLTCPSRLENLARLSIRKSICQKSTGKDIAPHLNSLPLPVPLKRFLLFYVDYNNTIESEHNVKEDFEEEMEFLWKCTRVFCSRQEAKMSRSRTLS